MNKIIKKIDDKYQSLLPDFSKEMVKGIHYIAAKFLQLLSIFLFVLFCYSLTKGSYGHCIYYTIIITICHIKSKKTLEKIKIPGDQKSNTVE